MDVSGFLFLLVFNLQFQTMVIPPYLNPGDCVGIISPSRKISVQELEMSIKIIQSWGFKVITGRNVFASSNQFAGSDDQRMEDFQKMLDNTEIKAVICSRGGYGSVRMIDSLDFSKFIASPKWIAGFSDITVFHSHINKNLGIATLHCEMPLNFAKKETHPDSIETIRKALTGEEIVYKSELKGFFNEGNVTGIITGGNLSVLYSLLGSVSDINTDGRILFIEDLDEYLYHIDRMMVAMKRAGKLYRIKGLIVGGLTGMKDNQEPFGKTAEEIVMEHVADLVIPKIFNFPSGHLTRNLSLKFGAETNLCVERGRYTLKQLT